MKLKEGFVLRQVAGSWVVVAVGPASVSFDGMLSLNDSGALLWKALSEGRDPVAALTGEYEVPPEQAARDVEEFLEIIRRAGCLAE